MSVKIFAIDRRRREWETENFGFLPVISDFLD